MSYYFLLFIAVIVGQLFVSAILIQIFQRKNPNIDYIKAVQVYFKKELPSYVIILTFTLLVMFILGDWMDLKLTRPDLLAKERLTRFEEAQLRFRTAASCYGVFAQLLAALFYRGGLMAIKKYGKSLGVTDLTDENTPS